jgi:hypothetical protein
MNDIYKQLDQVQQMGGYSAAYWDKMMHLIPDAPVVNRESFLLDRAKDKVVLDIGCTGPMGEATSKISAEYHGIDVMVKPAHVAVSRYYLLNLDRVDELPEIEGLDLVIAGEVIEHLSNAGHFLDLLRTYSVPVILTTPNAYGSVGTYYLNRGIEHVNSEHVAWYSWYTLTNLVERHGFDITEWYWYRGKPNIAEGMIFVLG